MAKVKKWHGIEELVDKEINTDSKDRLPNITEFEAEKLYDSSDEVRKRIF